ncbi:MAG: response regulator [Flammeovirgaceae bacterium]
MEEQHTILIVDDDPIQLKVVSELLKGMPYRLMMAQNGEKAVEITQRKQPDLIIMDWQMPAMTGIEAIKRIRSDYNNNDIPIVLTTGVMVSEDYLQLAFKEGASTYLKKPIGKLELLACIHSMLILTESNRKVHEKKQELEELGQQKDHMISVVAHDLKSPLNKLQGMIQLTQMEGTLNAEQADYINRMKGIIQDGKELIRDLLDIYSFEHHGSAINIVTINIHDLIHDCVFAFSKQLSDKQLDFQLHIEDDALQLATDPSFLKRILDNLISNSIKFSEIGQPIDLSTYKENDCLYFSIKDKGPGISEENKERMFQKFQRLNARPTAGESSTGLGLAIIKTLVEKLEGTIEVHSELGVGTEFIVGFPLQLNKSA